VSGRESWRTRQYRFQVRQIAELRQDLAEGFALNQHLAALAVAQLAGQLGSGRLVLDGIEAAELDALGCMIEAHLEDRHRRAEEALEADDVAERFPGEHHVAALYRGKGAGEY
jgi:hypothetical protein